MLCTEKDLEVALKVLLNKVMKKYAIKNHDCMALMDFANDIKNWKDTLNAADMIADINTPSVLFAIPWEAASSSSVN